MCFARFNRRRSMAECKSNLAAIRHGSDNLQVCTSSHWSVDVTAHNLPEVCIVDISRKSPSAQ